MKKGDDTMRSGMMCNKLQNRFASGFAVASLFPFFVK